MSDYPLDDLDFEEHAITEATKNGDWWGVRFDSLGIGVPVTEGIEPKTGSTIRLYGRGFGYQVRGIFIDGKKAYYRTEAEQEEENRLDLELSKQRRRDEFELHRAEREQDFRSLPPEFQARIARFRRNKPEFQIENEPYEIFCCKEAVKIAMKLGTPDAIEVFRAATWDEQKALIPEIDDGHSGNTFGAAVRLAWLYAHGGNLVEKEHGALCPLLGCKGYGCVPEGATEYQV